MSASHPKSTQVHARPGLRHCSQTNSVTDYSDLLQDRHADGHTTPQIDSEQNYELISLLESGGKTTMKFKRKFETCDPDDNTVQVNVFRITGSLNEPIY